MTNEIALPTSTPFEIENTPVTHLASVLGAEVSFGPPGGCGQVWVAWYTVGSFVSGCFCSANGCEMDPCCVSIVHSFLLPSSALLYKNTTFCLSVCLLVGIWLFSVGKLLRGRRRPKPAGCYHLLCLQGQEAAQGLYTSRVSRATTHDHRDCA